MVDVFEVEVDVIRRGQRFDAIVCDVIMSGLDGVAFHAALIGVDIAQASRIVFVTGGAPEMPRRAL